MKVQRKFLSSKVARRLFFLFVLAALVPITLVAILSYNYVNSLLYEHSREHLIASSKSYGMTIYDRLLIAEDQFIRSIALQTNEAVNESQSATNEKTTPLTNSSIITSIEYNRLPKDVKFSDLTHLNKGNTKLVISRDKFNSDVEIYMLRIQNEFDSPKLVSAKIKSNYIFGAMDIFSGSEDICIVIKNKDILNCSNNKFIALFNSNLNKLANDTHKIHSITLDSHNYTVASWELYLNGHFNSDSWIVYYTELNNTLFAPIKAFAHTLLPALLLAIILVSWISLQQISKMLIPLEKLSHLTKRIAKSEFDEKIKLTSNDEFQALGDSFNFMSSELAKREKELLQQANFDNLTGLPNRRALNAHIDLSIANTKDNNHCFAFLFIDLDRFKIVNDSQGHATGDKLLAAAASRIKSCSQGSDFIARYGGDEFVVIAPTTNDTNNISIAAEKIIKRLSDIFYIENYEQFIGASIGISIYPRDGNTYEELVQKADIAMYKAKQLGRGRYIYFTGTMQEKIREKAELEADLFHALERNEIFLAYQPQLNLATGKISGAEALIRWNHATKGVIRPDRFISYAEDNGYIVPLGEWVIKEAIRQCEQWQLQHKALSKISINISAKQLRHENFISNAEDLISDFDTGKTNVEFEITESLFLSDDEHTYNLLNKINKLGISIAIDDFGKGYSSLSYLKKLPVQTLKIDRLFIKDLGNDNDSQAIVKAIIAMGKALNKKVIAEGVENIGQLNILKDLGCEHAQGYYISTPKPANEIVINNDATIFKIGESNKMK